MVAPQRVPMTTDQRRRHTVELVVGGGVLGWLLARHREPFAILATLAMLALIVSLAVALWPIAVVTIALVLGVTIDRHHHRRQAGAR